MSALSEHRRQLGILAVEAMKVVADMEDAKKAFNEAADEIISRAKKEYENLDNALDKDNVLG